MRCEPVTPRELLLAGIGLPLCILLPTWLATSTPALDAGPQGDQLYYAAMAAGDQAPQRLRHLAPWCWRILTPWQVSLWPVGADPLVDAIRHFKALAFASGWLSLALLYAVLRRSGAEPAARVFGVLAFAGIHWTVKFSFRAPGYVDFQMLTLMLAILYLMLAGRTWWTLPLFVLAALQKETTLLLIPVVALQRFHIRRRFGAADATWGAAALVLATAALWAVRRAVPAGNDYSAVGAFAQVLGAQLPDPAFWPRFLVAISSGLGILPLLLAWRWRSVGDLLREQPHWLLLIVLSALALLGGVDKARLLLPMLPAVTVVAVLAWQPFLRDGGGRALAWAALTLLGNAYLGHHFEPMGPPGAALARLAPIHADAPMGPSLLRIAGVAAVWCAATAVLLRGAGAGGPDRSGSNGDG
jgi:hypothetical protein